MSFYMIGPYYKSRILAMFGDLFEDWLTLDLTMGNVMSLFTQLMYEMLMMLAPIFAIALLVALLGNYVQVGILFTGDPLKMKFSKLSPIQGFKNIFAMRTVVEFIKNILKLIVIGLVVFM